MQSETIQLRGLNVNVQRWGEPNLPKLFMLHGWMDCGATFQFMMPKIAEQFHVIAPDLRGFGETQHAPGGYWFADYFADLEALIDYYAPYGKVDLVGHSMGGNIVMMYAGIRPDRVGRVLSLEAFGLPPTEPSDSAGKVRKWLREILSDEPPRVYPSASVLKQSIYKSNPRLSVERIEQLAELWGKPADDNGAMMLKHDHHHRYANPVRYNFDDTMAIWKQATAKVGVVVATESPMFSRFAQHGRIQEIKDCMNLADEHYYVLENCGHMVHLEQPEQTAEIVLDFFVA